MDNTTIVSLKDQLAALRGWTYSVVDDCWCKKTGEVSLQHPVTAEDVLAYMKHQARRGIKAPQNRKETTMDHPKD